MHKYRLPQIMLVASVILSFGCGQNDADSEVSAASDETPSQSISLSAEEMTELGLESRPASSGTLELTSSFPGEIMVNQDRFTHLVPRVKGIVESVSYSEGDKVSAGDVLAVLDSRELADIKSEYLASIERTDLAQLTYDREERLVEQGISSESEFLQSRRDLAEAGIALRSASQKLLSLGFSESYIAELSNQPDHALVHYELVAPMSGMVLERHISQGESVTDDTDAFAIADLSQVWVDLDVFQEQLDQVREGQRVEISSAGGRLVTTGQIKFVRSTLGEETRTAVARIVLNNEDGRWRPGMFVNGVVTVQQVDVDVLVEQSAVISNEGHSIVFVQHDGGFEPREVETGRTNETLVEILFGISPGEVYVSSGAFALKAELAKSEMSDDHSH